MDLFDGDGPARGMRNPDYCSQVKQTGCVYEDQLFADRVYAAIRPDERPFFTFWAPRVAHSPLQVPQQQLDRFSFINDTARQIYHAMVFYIDEAIGNATRQLKESGQWRSTLMVLHSDNGGPIYFSGCCGGNNHPLKGGKLSNWEGGIRGAAFAAGGLLPPSMRGRRLHGLMAGWDWYATYAGLAGVSDPTDHAAAAAGLPPLDSQDLWPYLTGQVTASPRTELAIGDAGQVGGLIVAEPDGSALHKVLLGELSQAGWTGPVYPNTTLLPDGKRWDPNTARQTCGGPGQGAGGCLYELLSDEGEHTNLASAQPGLWLKMMKRLLEINATFFAPDRGTTDPAACDAALHRYGGVWGPWVLDLPP